MHLRLYKNVNAEIQEEWNAIVEILKQCNYDEDVYKNVLDAVEEYFRTLVQRKKEDKLFELERFMAQVYEENGRCEAAEVAALCLANLYNSGGHRKITPDESTHHPTPHHPHPEERIWAGRQPWVPDAPKIKHDKMKQFYMIDMERKRW